MDGQAADGALSVIVVLTNSGQDDVSERDGRPDRRDAHGPGRVGRGLHRRVRRERTSTNLTALAVGHRGAFIEAPAEGGVLEAIGGS